MCGWRGVLRICGKTGTANEKNKASRKHNDLELFISFAPYEKPRFAVVVMVENGASGGSTCAPVARDVIDRLQNLDKPGHPEPVDCCDSMNPIALNEKREPLVHRLEIAAIVGPDVVGAAFVFSATMVNESAASSPVPQTALVRQLVWYGLGRLAAALCRGLPTPWPALVLRHSLPTGNTFLLALAPILGNHARVRARPWS